jgi:hypothetical protein
MNLQNDSNASLIRKLHSVGYACFVRHLPLFEGDSDIAGAAADLQEKEDFTSKACRSRVSHARSILAAGQRNTALIIIADSEKVPLAVREAARTALEKSL